MTLPAFLADLENIGKHILQGIEKAAPIVAKFAAPIALVPVVGPALAEAAAIITQLEQNGNTVTPDDLALIVQTFSTAAHLKAAASASKP